MPMHLFVEKGEPILSIHISSKLSGTYQSACLARSHFPDALIEVVDSCQASGAWASSSSFARRRRAREPPSKRSLNLPAIWREGGDVLLRRLPRIPSSRGAYRQGPSLPGDPHEDQAPAESGGRRDPPYRKDTHDREAPQQVRRAGGKGCPRRKRSFVSPWRSRTTARSCRPSGKALANPRRLPRPPVQARRRVRLPCRPRLACRHLCRGAVEPDGSSHQGRGHRYERRSSAQDRGNPQMSSQHEQAITASNSDQ